MNCSKTQNKHPHSAVSGENPSAAAWMGPPGDLNLQSVCWHAYSTCSYAWLRHIRLWNSTSSAGPLTICHFLKYFPLRLFFTTSSRMGEDAAHNSLSLLCLWPFFFFFFKHILDWMPCYYSPAPRENTAVKGISGRADKFWMWHFSQLESTIIKLFVVFILQFNSAVLFP